MASVHRQDGSPYYFAFFRVPVGKQPDGTTRWHLIKRSTKKKSRNEAVAAAVEMERAAMKEARSDGDQSQKFLTVLRQAVDDAAQGLLTSALARDYIERIAEIATGEKVQTHTVDGWYRSWIADKVRSKSKGTSVRYSGVVEAFLSFISPAKRKGSIAGLSVEDLRAFRDAELDAGKSSATANLALKTLSMPLSLAVRQGILKVNPAQAVDRVATMGTEKDVFSVDDIKKLLAVADEEWRGVILFGYLTGARLHDITSLAWGNINLERGTLAFTAAKTQKGVEIPLHPSLRKYLLELAIPKKREESVFPHLAGRSTSGYSGLSMSFSRLMTKAKLVGKVVEAKGGKGRKRSSLSFHSLRHSFTSSLANAGVSPEIRQKLTGHLDAKTHQRYTHHELEALQSAISKMPEL